MMRSHRYENAMLFNALLLIFPESNASLLAELLQGNYAKEAIRYTEIDMDESRIKEALLLAFEERILIPLNSRGGPAWEDKILDFDREGLFFVPPVVKAILATMHQTGRPCCGKAVKKTLTEVPREDVDEFVKLLQPIMKHASNYSFETGLLEIFYKQAPLRIDLHDFLDIAVIGGMMSPRPRKSLSTGLSWYEINPVLYWDKTF